MNKTLIAYYSFSGNTRTLAESIAAQVSGELVEIAPQSPYAFDYNTAAKEARSEIAREFCPELLSGNEPIDVYDTVFVGTRNWFKSIAPPVLTFLRKHDFTGKTVAPFCTHGGGGFGEIERRIMEECPGAVFLPGFATTPEVTSEQIKAWLSDIGLLPYTIIKNKSRHNVKRMVY